MKDFKIFSYSSFHNCTLPSIVPSLSLRLSTWLNSLIKNFKLQDPEPSEVYFGHPGSPKNKRS